MAHYRITPLEKKSIEIYFEMYRQNPETGITQWFTVGETYRWGRGFIAEDMDVNLPSEENKEVYCRMDAGEMESSELEDNTAVFFTFDDSLGEDQQEEIKQAYRDGGPGWIYDGNHDWEIEDDYVVVYGPYDIEFCDEDGNVIRKVEPRKIGD